MNFCVYMKFSTLLDIYFYIYFYCWWFVENALQVFHLKVMQFLCICRNKQVIWNWFVYVGTKIFTPYIWINVQFLCKCRNKESLVFICKNKYLGFSGCIDQENGKNISDCELKKIDLGAMSILSRWWSNIKLMKICFHEITDVNLIRKLMSLFWITIVFVYK